MKQGIFTVRENAPLAGDVYRLVLAGDTSGITAPGQFVNLLLPGLFLRRPISVCDWDGEAVTLLYKVVGAGTEEMSRFAPGTELDMLTGLGNGFDLSASGSKPLLVGGGIGVAPLYRLARELLSDGKRPAAVLGYNSREEMIYADEFRALGAEVTVATADGSCGVKGFVTDALPLSGTYDYVFACGPAPMLRALDGAVSVPGQFSLEERMGCGFGACMGCVHKAKGFHKRVCKDGPVFRREEIVW